MSLPLVLAPTFILVALTMLLTLCAGGGFSGGRGLGRGGLGGGGLGGGGLGGGGLGGRIASGWRGRAVSASGCATALDLEYRLPILLYVLTVVSMATRHADLVFVLLAWLFAALRVLLAAALVTGRSGSSPGLLDAASALVLAVAWGVFAVRILLGF
ncbi:hypothetical protein [Rhodoplanes azumiensis]|uniref:MAPEG family protein n=1 Tax=Rhodoplanes azumiensis TaxID=1897628 RepID=A0ABW5AEA5_9BRAD